MRPDDIALVRATLAIATENRLETAALFYGRLFKRAPQMQPLLGDLHAHAGLLMGVVSLVAGKLDRLEEIEPELAEMAQRWTMGGVIAEHYGLFGDALIFAISERIGRAFTPRVAEAWARCYAKVAHIMAAGAEGDHRLAA
jgi:hemoglobin-like flavoprotein